MARFIVTITMALTVMSAAANAAKNFTPTPSVANSNRHTCEPGSVFRCEHHSCSCHPE